MLTDYNGNHYCWDPKNVVWSLKHHIDVCWRLYCIYESIEALFYDHPELEAEVHDIWETFKEHLQKVVDYADELYVKGYDPTPERIPLAGPPYNLDYILQFHTKWHTDFLIADMENAKEWFENLRGDEPEYKEWEEALTHYKRAFKRLSNLSL